MQASADPIGILLEQHVALEELFARHQAAVLDRRLEQAARLLADYAKFLLCHIELEELHLLPYCARIEMLRWPIDVYRDEHRRIVEHLDKAEQRLARARRGDARSRTIIALLDEERTFKHLLEHHHEREERGLFCEIRAELPLEARAALMSDVMACAHH